MGTAAPSNAARGVIRTAFRIFSGAVVLVTLASCTDSPVASSQPAESSFESGWEQPADPIVAPLTGLEANAETISGPAISVKVPNDSYGARPQSGLNSADVVYEELVEGGITRYVAQFQSTLPENIGPTRSIRPMDPLIISPVGGVVAYSGGQAEFVSMMQATGIPNVSEGSEYLYRETSRSAPNNLYLRLQAVAAAYQDQVEAPAQQFSYAQSATVSTGAQGAEVATIGVQMSTSSQRSWTWNTDSGRWLRAQDGVTDTDALDGSQIAAVNVIVAQVSIDYGTYAAMHGSPPLTQWTGSGTAWFASNGRVSQGSWSKGAADESVVFRDENGFPVRLAPGNTWIELMPTDSGAINLQ